MAGDKPRVAVLRGGVSGERAVSLESGAGVLAALRSRGYPARDMEVTADLRWIVDGGAPLDLAGAIRLLQREVDLVFPALHGPFGEDGVVQGLLESAGVPFVGSGVAASAIAMDKALTRRIATTLDIAVAPAFEAGPETTLDDLAAACRDAARMPPPWFVKPACSGSSVGVSRVDAAADLGPALQRALGEGGRVVVEAGVAGIEVSCPVLGHAYAGARALPVIEIVPRSAAFFDYDAKYTAGHSDEICPARIDEGAARRIQAASVRMHDVLGCRSLSRSDFILREDGVPVFLEINTMPGFTPVSLFPRAAAAEGMSYADLVCALVDGAVRRV